MACQACQVALNNRFSTFNLTAHTHDVSQVNAHVTTTQWLQDLTNAINVAWPKRFRRYLQAAVLMLSWENGDITNESLEFKRLKSVFENEFGYEVHEWKIPWTRSGFELNGRVREFVGQYYGPNNLLIVYYAGHARRGDSPGSYPIWFPSQREGVVPEASTIPEANTASISSLLAEGDADAPDVLTLYDCCHPLCTQHGTSRPSNAVIESLCAGGFESEVPMPGPDSFTFALVDELSLAAHSNQPISVPELHKKLIRRLELFQQRARWNRDESRQRSQDGDTVFTMNGRRTPVYVSLSVHRPVRTIMLTPIRRESNVQFEVTNPNARSKLACQDPPSVLLVVRVSEDETSAREEVKTWLLSSPPGVIEFKGFYQSYSTLILVEIALEVWDLLPSCPATTFAGFTNELLPTISPNAGPSWTQGSQTLKLKPVMISATKLRRLLQMDLYSTLPIYEQSEQDGFFTLLEYLNQIRPKEISEWKSLHIKHQIETNLPTSLFVQFCQWLVNDKSVDGNVKGCLLMHEEFISQYLYARGVIENTPARIPGHSLQCKWLPVPKGEAGITDPHRAIHHDSDERPAPSTSAVGLGSADTIKMPRKLWGLKTTYWGIGAEEGMPPKPLRTNTEQSIRGYMYGERVAPEDEAQKLDNMSTDFADDFF